jgi:hypothetical protein
MLPGLLIYVAAFPSRWHTFEAVPSLFDPVEELLGYLKTTARLHVRHLHGLPSDSVKSPWKTFLLLCHQDNTHYLVLLFPPTVFPHSILAQKRVATEKNQIVGLSLELNPGPLPP